MGFSSVPYAADAFPSLVTILSRNTTVRKPEPENLFEDFPTNKPAVASGPLSSKNPDPSPRPYICYKYVSSSDGSPSQRPVFHLMLSAACCTENGYQLDTQLADTVECDGGWY